MKKLLFAVAAVAALSGTPALAADMPVKAPAYAAYGWAGFYVGANIGVSIARNPSSGRGTDIGEGLETFNLDPVGIVGGGELGYNWQVLPNWVIGIETDFQGSSQTDSTTCVFICPDPSLSFNQKLNWFGTLRGRMGWTNGPALFYATGGLAYGKVSTDLRFVDVVGGGDVVAGSFSQTKLGYAVGGGIEAQLFGPWTGKIEYLYLDLGSVSGAVTATTGAFAGDTFLFSSKVRDNIVRAGLNYKFGDPVRGAEARADSLFANSPPVAAYDWTGFYVGTNVGLSVARDPTTSAVTCCAGGVDIADRINLSPIGIIGGAQIGYNWQTASNLVFGLESDVQASSANDSTTCVYECGGPGGNLLLGQKLPWFVTARGRIGWTSGPVLLYATGGWAYGEITTDLNFDGSCCAPFSRGVAVTSFSQRKSGGTVGAGVEARLAGNWTAKIEYLFLDFGSVSGSVIPTGGSPGTINRVDFTSHVQDHIVRVGLNYKFGS